MIEVRLFGGLQLLTASGRSRFTAPYREGITVSDIMSEEQLSPDVVGVIFVNGRHASADTLLNDEDRLSFFTPAGGG